MKKASYINQIIRNLIIIAFLIWVFLNNSGLMKYMIIPFIICIILSINKNIFLLIGKNKYANIFNKLYTVVFLLFAFGFIIFWSYIVAKQKNYIMLLFTIPFWIIGIYIVRKCFLKKSEKDLSNKRRSKFNISVIIPCFLVLTVLASGFFCLIIGIKDTYNINKTTKDYLTTTSYFKDYEIFNSDERWEHNRTKTYTTYRLIYTYKVDNKEYTIKTDYGNGYIPDINSTRKVKYNPNNPSEAVLIGTNRNEGLIYFGAFFVLGGMVFVLIFLQTKGIFDKTKIDVIGTYVGVAFTIIGIGIILMQNGITSSFIETLKVMKFWILIPLMFIVVGILVTIRSLLLPKLAMKNREKYLY